MKKYCLALLWLLAVASVLKGQMFLRPATASDLTQQVTAAAALDLTGSTNVLENGSDATVDLPDLAPLPIGHTITYIGGDAFTYTIQPQTGQQVNNVVDGQRSIKQDERITYVKRSATSWNSTLDNIQISGSRITLIDVDAVNNTFYAFSTGETWAQVKQNYEYIVFTGNVSQNGSSNVRPFSKVLTPTNIELLGSNSGYFIEFDDALNSVNNGINLPSDADLGFTYIQSAGDAPANGRMQFTVIGVKKEDYIPVGTLVTTVTDGQPAFFRNGQLEGRGDYSAANAGGIPTADTDLADIGFTLQAGDEILLQLDIGMAHALWSGGSEVRSTRIEGGVADNSIVFTQSGTVLRLRGNNTNGTRQWLKVKRGN